MSENLTTNNDDTYDIVFDLSFLANAVTAQMQLIEAASENEYFTIEHIELDGENINVIARKHERVVN